MRALSKSKLLAYRQCPKRLWLEIHHPEWHADSAATQASFNVEHQVGEIAIQVYDPWGKGGILNPKAEGFDVAFTRTRVLLKLSYPIFEAGFCAEGAMAFADVMLPMEKSGKRAWRMVEVKSSTSVKDYHRDDVAVQAFIVRSAGVPLVAVALAHIDSEWIYPGNGDYRGLLKENDLTEESFSKNETVQHWIKKAQSIVTKPNAPAISTGKHCTSPYECGFLAHCQSQKPEVEHPIHWLPGRFSKALLEYIDIHNLSELQDLPDELLNVRQQRVKKVTVTGQPYFDQSNAARSLAVYKLPAYFLDFETIQFAVPIWKGTRPYQQVPFQFSLHRLSRMGNLKRRAFLDISGADPSEAFAEALIVACGKRGAIFVYNASFETARIRELSERFPHLAKPLLALNKRIVDLLPVARDHYYHPSQQGSWSLKALLPALCPDLSYDDLDGVQDGSMAMDAFLEALAPLTNKTQKTKIKKQLLAYCALDTLALVSIWSAFTGRKLKY